jgi:hypothetical protein
LYGGVVWTKAAFTCPTRVLDTEQELVAFDDDVRRWATRRTRWILPPRGVLGGVLGLAVAPVFHATSAMTTWVSAAPRLRFAAMFARVGVDLSNQTVVVDRTTRLAGLMFHKRRLSIADELIVRAAQP